MQKISPSTGIRFPNLTACSMSLYRQLSQPPVAVVVVVIPSFFRSFLPHFIHSFIHSCIHSFIQELCITQGVPCLKTTLHVPVSSILFSLSMVSHSPSYSIHASFFRSSFLGVPPGVYSRILGNIFPRTLCVQNTVNSFYPLASIYSSPHP